MSLTEEGVREAVRGAGLRVLGVRWLQRVTTPRDKPADHTGVFFVLAKRDAPEEEASNRPAPAGLKRLAMKTFH